ncbi:hypothetical protein PF002_g3704 [Phytophthora fragariae]|uniref:Uncharacterized protein n=1 Tax=Phytophthora fragariae TaxID=53985 RepID=A0A6A3UNJ9_9STRA|nr:hypothetical protein PF006_g2673 [Phytophthora fragariae]KAE9252708.1 hypothetical protein PF002_g3704 [Phytophthora fragariae]
MVEPGPAFRLRVKFESDIKHVMAAPGLRNIAPPLS